jgi:SAM-dependent methyltransferase
VSSHQILSQAVEHIPALLLVWLSIYAVYWVLGIAKWPAAAWRGAVLERAGSLDIESMGGFRFGSLALVSLISLFLELLLIRWISSEIRVFAFFKSLALIAAFLGFGLGCYLTKRRVQLAYTTAPLLCILWLTEMPWDPVRRLIINLSNFIGWFSDVHMFGRAYFQGQFLWGIISASMAMSIVIPVFGLIAMAMVPFGQLVGWHLEHSTNGILAYSINIGASVIGIWLFTALGFLSTPPIVWFLLLALGLIACFWRLPRVRRTFFVLLAAIIALFGIGTQKSHWWGEQSWKGTSPALRQLEPGQVQTFWSPYQKLSLIPLKKGNDIVRYVLNTNDSWYQEIVDLSDVAVARHPEFLGGIPVQYHQYNLPYQFYKNPPRVLIAGAGMGNDVAAALRNGAGHVTAVEIDPLIYESGKRLHFEQPYHSDRVDLRVDDARSFVQNTSEMFDLVVFSILDSHTTASSYTNIRLDNYVYTVEAMQAIGELLNPDGLFVMSFSSERPWFAGRLRDVITRVFGKEPLMVQRYATFFVVGNGDRVDAALAADPTLGRFVQDNSDIALEEAEPTTDDWPYLYLQHRGMPTIVWLLALGLIGVCWLTFTRLRTYRAGIQWHVFWLGAAFMLLEVQIISKSALLFGTTWLVNSIVITALLLFSLLANLVISVMPRFPQRLAYVGLFTTLALGFLIPTNALHHRSLLLRGVVTTAVYCSPVFFAGLIFTSSFRQLGFQAEAFGSNLLGSLFGGLLDSLSYLLGIKALVIVAAFLYLLSLLTMGRVGVTISLAEGAIHPSEQQP